MFKYFGNDNFWLELWIIDYPILTCINFTKVYQTLYISEALVLTMRGSVTCYWNQTGGSTLICYQNYQAFLLEWTREYLSNDRRIAINENLYKAISEVCGRSR